MRKVCYRLLLLATVLAVGVSTSFSARRMRVNKLLASRAKLPPATAPKMTGDVAGALSRKTAANADRDAKDAALEARLEVLEKEVSDLKKVSHSHKPKVCCRAMSKACLACSQGITEAEFCRKNEGKYGCEYGRAPFDMPMAARL